MARNSLLLFEASFQIRDTFSLQIVKCEIYLQVRILLLCCNFGVAPA
ncbi:hypothetical protein AE03_02233 [Klebsiella aerogenes MGH 77]|nr:hypothetical protein AE03_02233 [Klebsiella aerogenes MGH 77]